MKLTDIIRFNILSQSPFSFRLNGMDTKTVSRDEIILDAPHARNGEIVFRRSEIGDNSKPQLHNFKSDFLIGGVWQ